MELVVITGMSGAGKSKAVGSLEDIGYFCVDNIPPAIMPVFADLLRSADRTEIQKAAIVLDARSREIWGDVRRTLSELRASGLPCRVLFLDAATEVLISRYKETRRRHPLMDESRGSLREAVLAERELMAPLREIADVIIDTSHTVPAQLRERVIGAVASPGQHTMDITCMSFGYRNGLPPEADLVFDVRCLPNPYYIPELREHTGDEPCVRDYILGFPQTLELYERLEALLALTVPLYIQEGKNQLVIAVGCTGGKHRSVATAIQLGAFLQESGYRVTVAHRDRGKAAYS